MSGSPRDALITAVAGPIDVVPAPVGVQAGDTLIALITTTSGNFVTSIEGGSPWLPQHDLSAPGADLRTLLFTQTAETDNPTTYAVNLVGSALVTILHLRGATTAGIVIEPASGNFLTAVTAPASTGGAGAVEIRYAVALGLGSATDWDSLSYDVTASGLDDLVSATIGASTLLSSMDVDPLEVPHDSAVQAWQAWTIVAPAGVFTPEPPNVPAFAPRGRALYRYTCHDLLTGRYIDDIYPTDVTFDKRINEPGSFSGTLPIPNRRVAAAVRRIIPKVKTDLTTGPGRVEIRIWRDGVLQPRYWLTGARIVRGRDGKITVQLRGCTLDGFFYSVRVRDERSYSGDQVANVRALLQHAQSLDGANIGLQFQPGSSGVTRPLLATKDQGTTYGRAAQEYARTSGGFESTVNDTVGPSGVESTWEWGYPQLGTGARHVFSESPHGGDIAEWDLDIDALRGGTDWEVRGGTPETDATETRAPMYSAEVTTPHRAAGHPRIDHLVDHPAQSTDQTTLDDYARYWAEKAGGALWVRTVTVYLGRTPSLTMNSIGDYGRLVMTNVWLESQDGGAGLDAAERIIGISIRPTRKGQGRDEGQLVLASPEVPG